MEPRLLAALVLAILTVVVIVLRTRLDAFFALLFAALVTGFVAGAPVAEVVEAVTTGFGDTLGSIGIVIGLGVGLGKILEVSGAADALARAFVRALGTGREDWAMGGTGALVAIPVFCDSGFVIMNPLARSIARSRRAGYVTLALTLGCGMTLTHHLVPPAPGPLGVAGILGADVGGLVLAGLAFTVVLLPVVVGYARWIGPKLEGSLLPEVRRAVYGRAPSGGSCAPAGEGEKEPEGGPAPALGTPPRDGKPHRVGPLLAMVPLLVTLLLMIANTVVTAVGERGAESGGDTPPSAVQSVVMFLGSPVVALLVGLVLAVYVLLPRWTPRSQVDDWLSEAASSAGLIILVTGAGGALAEVLRGFHVSDTLAAVIASWGLPGVLVPFLVASLVRLAQGSGTVAMITAASVSAPLGPELHVSPLLAAIACCTGAMVFSYFNHSYFWVVTRLTGLDGTAALRGWSGITTAVWLASPPLLLAAGTFV